MTRRAKARSAPQVWRRRGLTLVETLVALTVLAVAGAALASVQLGALRAGRTAEARHLAADALALELLFQRVGPAASAGACSAAALPAGWLCSVQLTCPDAAHGCSLQVIEVSVTPPEGRALLGATARYAPLVGGP